jgi:hypothetical protein
MDAVQRQIDSWMDRRPYTTFRQTDTDCTRHGIGVRVKKRPDFERWSLIAGDGFHNLRSSLDHLVYAVAVHEIDPSALTPKIKKALAFPIYDRPEDFRSRWYRIEPLSPAVRTEIETLQPYNRPHPKLPPLLSVLRDFDDVDKHRLLQMAIAQVIDGQFSNVNVAIPSGGKLAIFMHREEIVDGTEIAAILTGGPTPNMRYDFKANLGISLPHAIGPLNNHRSGVGYLFDALRDEVNVVIDRVRAKVVV